MVDLAKSGPVLEVKGISKFYGSVRAIQDVSFSLVPGQVLACLGPNGSGKSTTIKMLIGLVKATSGEVLFEGKDIHRDLPAYRKRLGYVPEEANLYPHLTGHEFLNMIGTLRLMPKPQLEMKIDSLLSLFRLYPFRHQVLGLYSKGMRQRILLIAALMDNPDLYIFDEPLSGLDVTSVLIFRNLIQSLSARGRMVVYCSHLLEQIEHVCSHLLILANGQVVVCGPAEEMRERLGQASLERIFMDLVADDGIVRTANNIIEVIASP
jgi:ABC-2 type transport system ATP-binding protein